MRRGERPGPAGCAGPRGAGVMAKWREIWQWRAYQTCMSSIIRKCRFVNPSRVNCSPVYEPAGSCLGLVRGREDTNSSRRYPGTSLAKRRWLAAWHICNETYSRALTELVNYQRREPNLVRQRRTRLSGSLCLLNFPPLQRRSGSREQRLLVVLWGSSCLPG